MLRKQEIRMKEQEKKKKGNLWLTVATFIVNKRKAIEILFVLAIIYSVLCVALGKISKFKKYAKTSCGCQAHHTLFRQPALMPLSHC